MLDHAPRFDADSAAQLARDLYGLDGRATALSSERDQNFLLATTTGDRVVLKIANALEDRSVIVAQQQVMSHLASTFDIVPRVIPTVSGETITDIIAADGRHHLAWAVTHVPGVPLATSARRTPALFETFGRRIGELSKGLSDFDHPAIHRAFHWDLAKGREVIDTYRSLIDDPQLGATIDVLLARFDREVAPLLPALRRSALHNDLNDHNVLVGGGDDLYSRDQRIVGIVDFGDMVFSYTIGDLAIAAAYAILGVCHPERAQRVEGSAPCHPERAQRVEGSAPCHPE
ncbi:MAG: phosphotransferase, partial [bacterium]